MDGWIARRASQPSCIMAGKNLSYLVSLDVRPPAEVKSLRSLEHQVAVGLELGQVEHDGRRRDLEEVLPNILGPKQVLGGVCTCSSHRGLGGSGAQCEILDLAY